MKTCVLYEIRTTLTQKKMIRKSIVTYLVLYSIALHTRVLVFPCPYAKEKYDTIKK